MSKLTEIVVQRRLDVAEAKTKTPEDKLVGRLSRTQALFGDPLSLSLRLSQTPPIEHARMHVAAEFKRASPSKGAIAEAELKLKDQVSTYTQAGASLVSVLTEPKWFKGSLEDMLEAKEVIWGLDPNPATRPLVLRKDFIIDEYQLLEALAYGADTVLLIVAILPTDAELTQLITASRKLGMEPLVEAATPSETLRALHCGAQVLGINNRDLSTFKLDLGTTIRCAQVCQDAAKVALISLSGMKTREDVAQYESLAVVRGVLVGEHLMTCADPARELRALVVTRSPRKDRRPRVKICGVVRVEDALVACRAKADFIGLIFVPQSPRRVSEGEARAIVEAVRGYRESQGRIVVEVAAPKRARGEHALELACRRGTLLVGVFMNQAMEEINRMVGAVGLDLVQLHGHESAEEAARCDVPVIKVVHVVQGELFLLRPETFSSNTVALLLDSALDKKSLAGGTGKPFAWSVAAGACGDGDLPPLIVAGGLTCDNVDRAVSEAGFPFAMDCSSGVQVEGCAREKDPALMRRFIQLVKDGESY